jgi:hypothetical protein
LALGAFSVQIYFNFRSDPVLGHFFVFAQKFAANRAWQVYHIKLELYDDAAKIIFPILHDTYSM